MSRQNNMSKDCPLSLPVVTGSGQINQKNFNFSIMERLLRHIIASFLQFQNISVPPEIKTITSGYKRKTI